MRRLFLLRAYGDFVIAIRAILNSPQPSDTKIIASNHFIPLFEAINEVFDLSPLDIEFQDFGINQSLLNFFTDKQLFTFQTIRQIVKIKRYLKRKDKIMGNELISDKIKKKNEKMINKKISNIVSDLHWKTIKYLTDNNEVILMGNMSTLYTREDLKCRFFSKTNQYGLTQIKTL